MLCVVCVMTMIIVGIDIGVHDKKHGNSVDANNLEGNVFPQIRT